MTNLLFYGHYVLVLPTDLMVSGDSITETFFPPVHLGVPVFLGLGLAARRAGADNSLSDPVGLCKASIFHVIVPPASNSCGGHNPIAAVVEKVAPVAAQATVGLTPPCMLGGISDPVAAMPTLGPMPLCALGSISESISPSLDVRSNDRC